jgi:diguanylate cyclase (GGDEF)-like protein
MQPFYLNTFLGASFTIILMVIDYTRKYNTNAFQRSIFLALLGATLAAAAADFTSDALGGLPGLPVHYGLYASVSVFLTAQNLSFYLCFVFIDYFAYKNEERSGKMLKVLFVLMILYAVSVLVNLPLGYYFYISEDNSYTPSKLYLLRLCISYFPLLLAFADVLVSAARFRQAQIFSLIFFGVLTASGAALDIVLRTGNLIWPCYTAALLYFYFFIIQSDSRLDSLTGLGNRFNFNEFIMRLSRQGSKEPYSIAMIDMDHFKEINDTLGHLEGDNALRDMASIIKGCIRETDFAARYGGDEFILAVNSENNIEKLMERIQQAIDNQNEKGRRPYRLQMSYGWDVFTADSGRSMEDFLVHIDKLMYKNKMSKRSYRRKS